MQSVKEVNSLINGLESGMKGTKGKKREGFSCKRTTFPVPGAPGLSVNSWKFSDWDYKRDDLPTYARGLFTHKRKDGSSEIAIRGYDKFFNTGEVNDTNWTNIYDNTRGPYELSVKENGCIIFISGLDDDILLVCSKHSTGARADVNLSHSSHGEQWVDRHLASVGKTRKDLARELRRMNATAVAELCDDTFEEHVLAYDPASSGLYLHGINLNLPEFATYSSSMVHKFADTWGFKKAEYLVQDDIQTVKTYLEDCAKTGSWNGRDTEGFVIRCQKKIPGSKDKYEDWFFKYKFEEPYLMYRQWRECTKAVIANRVPRFKKHQKITEEYLLYARRQLARNPGLAKLYNANHGIIAMRDGFLAERGLKGSDIIRQEQAEGTQGAENVSDHKIILVPVASIGCGKTTLAHALVQLYGWGHIQNDNITGQKGRPKQFALQLCNTLTAQPVVIADRNNHQKRERKQIFEDVAPVIQNAKFVALHYVHHPKDRMLPNIRRVTQERVLERGDNHQTIHANTKSRTEIIGIMEGFLNRFEPVDPHMEPDCNFDEVIDLDITEDTRYNLETVVNALHKFYPSLVPSIPSSAELDDAIAAALNDYAPSIKHDLSFKSKNKGPQSQHQRHPEAPKSARKDSKLEYFALKLPTPEITSALDATFKNTSSELSQFYTQLQKTRRVQQSFHVTLIHRAVSSSHTDLWEKLTALHISAQNQQTTIDPVIGKCKVELQKVVWDKRVMCIVVKILEGEGGNEWNTVNTFAHVTVGTADHSIKPKESNALLEKWASGQGEGIRDLDVKGAPVCWGQVRGVTHVTR